VTRQEFGSRAVCASGTIGGSPVGVAKGVRMVSVCGVLGCFGSITAAVVIAGSTM
jgi:hypothetical protein